MFALDLSEIMMLPADVPVRAVGWLDCTQTYSQGFVCPEVYRKLRELLHDPWEPAATAGWHECNLCRFEAEARGKRNLFVLSGEVIYCCPELITHYINAHGYCPPQEFCLAVLACPGTHLIEYKRLLVKLGVVRGLKRQR